MQVVECRRYLNQCLQKALLRLFQYQPDALPMLMSQEEFCSPVAGKALRKRSTIPVKKHPFSICDLLPPISLNSLVIRLAIVFVCD